MTIIQQGSINLTSLIVPNVYVQVIPPSVASISGAPTDILGIVGTAEWGPVNSIKTIADMANYSSVFGQILPEKYDAGTACANAVQQAAKNMRIVRVTDGTDVKATKNIVDNDAPANDSMSLTALYSGGVGNTINVDISSGSNSTVAVPTFKVTITRLYYVSEIFDNIGGAAPADVWANIIDAINNGQNDLRGKSQLVVAALLTPVTSPDIASYVLAGGTNGNSGVDCSNLIGADTTPRSGMYCFRNSQCAVMLLQGCDDDTSWANQAAFGSEEGIYMILVGKDGQYTDLDTAITDKKDSGVDNYEAKILLGDWVYWDDTVNRQTRLVSPQAFIGGLLVTQGPQNTSLNKVLNGIVATESSDAGVVYTDAELANLISAGIDLIVNPSVGGNYFSARTGHNSSSNIVLHGDNYPKMTNFLSKSLNSNMGSFIGKTITSETFDDVRNSLTGFLHVLKNEEIIEEYSVVSDASNNPQSQTAVGYLRADVKVRYLGITEFLVVNLEGGSTVTVTVVSRTQG